MRVVRSVLAVVFGLFLLSLVAEGIEVAIVTALHGSFTQDHYTDVKRRLEAE
jgi:hypothetical protein